jgi:predicted DNA-binding protein
MTTNPLSQVPRELAVKLIVGSITCPTVDQAEAVIREAIEKTLEEVERATAHLSCDYCKAVRQVPAIICSLKQSAASSLTEQETEKC